MSEPKLTLYDIACAIEVWWHIPATDPVATATHRYTATELAAILSELLDTAVSLHRVGYAMQGLDISARQDSADGGKYFYLTPALPEGLVGFDEKFENPKYQHDEPRNRTH